MTPDRTILGIAGAGNEGASAPSRDNFRGKLAGARILSRTHFRGNPFPRFGRFVTAFVFSVVFLLTAPGGCGVPPTFFPHALTNEQGDPILLEDVDDILSDDTLSEDEKRAALRDLGIEDEKLIDALLSS